MSQPIRNTRSMWPALAILIGIAALAAIEAPQASAGSGQTWRERSDQVVDANGLTGLVIENARGDVSVEASPDRKIHISALKVVRGSDRERARRFSESTRVETGNESGRFAVRVRYPQHRTVRVSFWDLFSDFEFPHVEVRLTVQAPPDIPVWLTSTSGDLETHELAGAQTLQTTSGDIGVGAAPGVVRAQTTSGDVEVVGAGGCRVETVSGDVTVREARGSVVLATTSGEVVVEGAVDSVRIVTVSGDIRVGEARKGLSARSTSGQIAVHVAGGVVRIGSASGDVTLGLQGPLAGADVSTGSGDIEARLMGSLGCRLEVSTANGTVDVGVPLAVRSVTRREVSGVVRQGGPTVVLKSSSGDINVTSGGNQ